MSLQESSPHTPPPPEDQHPPRSFVLPVGATDTHAHVIGVAPEYPFIEKRAYTPEEITPDRYLAMLDDTGLDRGVLVQVTVHGTDNRLMIQTVKRNQHRLRGVAVMRHDLPDHVYADADAAGVRGLRLNPQMGTEIGLENLDRFDALVSSLGWHLQIQLDGRSLPDVEASIRRLRSTVVIDHMGNMPYGDGVDHPGFQALVGLVRDGAWVKLSCGFRFSSLPDWSDSIPFAQALAEIAPERCLWGSDWPHVMHWRPMPRVGELLDLLAQWVPDEALRNRILVDNPARLYGF